MKIIKLTILLMLCTSCGEHLHKQYKGYYKIGEQYTINDQTYFPQHYNQYAEMGIASWYSDDCYKCKTSQDCDKCVTANGEIFNKNLLTAAHRTLPMPSLIKIINLENGKTAILKVNDRGPFRNNRIIDVSEKAAEVLGFKKQGLAMVRVEYLKNASEKLIKSKSHYKKSYTRIIDNLKRQRIPSSFIESSTFFINQQSIAPTRKETKITKKNVPSAAMPLAKPKTTQGKKLKTPQSKDRKAGRVHS